MALLWPLLFAVFLAEGQSSVGPAGFPDLVAAAHQPGAARVSQHGRVSEQWFLHATLRPLAPVRRIWLRC